MNVQSNKPAKSNRIRAMLTITAIASVFMLVTGLVFFMLSGGAIVLTGLAHVVAAYYVNEPIANVGVTGVVLIVIGIAFVWIFASTTAGVMVGTFKLLRKHRNPPAEPQPEAF